MSAKNERWEKVIETIRKTFPTVEQLKPGKLAAWLKDKKREQPLLLDIREEDEYQVSHLKNARRLDPGSDPAEQISGIAKDTPLVLYCSVGYRSSQQATKLIEAGYTKIYNLEGSIFAWANEGYPVFKDGKEIKQVHPFNTDWGQLLNKKYHPKKQ